MKEDTIPQADVAVKSQGGDGHKQDDVDEDNGGTPEGKLENDRRMISNAGKHPQGHTRLGSDNGGRSAWLNGKESGVSRRPRP